MLQSYQCSGSHTSITLSLPLAHRPLTKFHLTYALSVSELQPYHTFAHLSRLRTFPFEENSSAEAAEPPQRKPERRTSGAVFIDNDASAGMLAAEALGVEEWHSDDVLRLFGDS